MANHILAYITLDSNRALGGSSVILLAKDPSEQLEMATDLAKALRADLLKMKNGDLVLIG